jgi:hypothetical protein
MFAKIGFGANPLNKSLFCVESYIIFSPSNEYIEWNMFITNFMKILTPSYLLFEGIGNDGSI